MSNVQKGKYNLEELDILLNSWPENTNGYIQDSALITVLDTLGEKYGYGFLKQIAEWLADLQTYENEINVINRKRQRFNMLNWPLPEGFDELAERIRNEQ